MQIIKKQNMQFIQCTLMIVIKHVNIQTATRITSLKKEFQCQSQQNIVYKSSIYNQHSAMILFTTAKKLHL